MHATRTRRGGGINPEQQEAPPRPVGQVGSRGDRRIEGTRQEPGLSLGGLVSEPLSEGLDGSPHVGEGQGGERLDRPAMRPCQVEQSVRGAAVRSLEQDVCGTKADQGLVVEPALVAHHGQVGIRPRVVRVPADDHAGEAEVAQRLGEGGGHHGHAGRGLSERRRRATRHGRRSPVVAARAGREREQESEGGDAGGTAHNQRRVPRAIRGVRPGVTMKKGPILRAPGVALRDGSGKAASMGLFKRVSSWFGSNGHQHGATAGVDPPTPSDEAARPAGGPLAQAVTIDLHDPSDDAAGAPVIEPKPTALDRWASPGAAPEATDIELMVRRVDERLAQVEERGRRLFEIAESVPDAIGVLPTLCAQNAELIQAAHQIVDETRSGSERLDASLARLASAGERQAERLESSSQTHAELVEALAEFRAVMGRFADEAAIREQDLMGMVASGRKWVVGALAIGGAAGVAVLALVALEVLRV